MRNYFTSFFTIIFFLGVANAGNNNVPKYGVRVLPPVQSSNSKSKHMTFLPGKSSESNAPKSSKSKVSKTKVKPSISAPVISAPVISAPVISAPVISAPVISAPVINPISSRRNSPTARPRKISASTSRTFNELDSAINNIGVFVETELKKAESGIKEAPCYWNIDWNTIEGLKSDKQFYVRGIVAGSTAPSRFGFETREELYQDCKNEKKKERPGTFVNLYCPIALLSPKVSLLRKAVTSNEIVQYGNSAAYQQLFEKFTFEFDRPNAVVRLQENLTNEKKSIIVLDIKSVLKRLFTLHDGIKEGEKISIKVVKNTLTAIKLQGAAKILKLKFLVQKRAGGKWLPLTYTCTHCLELEDLFHTVGNAVSLMTGIGEIELDFRPISVKVGFFKRIIHKITRKSERENRSKCPKEAEFKKWLEEGKFKMEPVAEGSLDGSSGVVINNDTVVVVMAVFKSSTAGYFVAGSKANFNLKIINFTITDQSSSLPELFKKSPYVMFEISIPIMKKTDGASSTYEFSVGDIPIIIPIEST